MKQTLAIGFNAHFSEDFKIDWYSAEIVEQSHRSAEFGVGREFYATNGTRIVSDQFPDNGLHDKLKPSIYVRGYLVELDRESFKVKLEELDQIVAAVREFNAHEFGNPGVVPEPQHDFDFVVR